MRSKIVTNDGAHFNWVSKATADRINGMQERGEIVLRSRGSEIYWRYHRKTWYAHQAEMFNMHVEQREEAYEMKMIIHHSTGNPTDQTAIKLLSRSTHNLTFQLGCNNTSGYTGVFKLKSGLFAWATKIDGKSYSIRGYTTALKAAKSRGAFIKYQCGDVGYAQDVIQKAKPKSLAQLKKEIKKK